MASIYKRKDSPYLWIKYSEKGKLIQRSTGFQKGVAQDVRKARLLEAEKTADELRGAPNHRAGWTWVHEFIKARYGESLTARNYRAAWVTVEMFLKEKTIESPVALTRQHCFEYIAWRQKEDLSKGRYKARHNTALVELGVLGVVMSEAVEREMARANPCLRLKIKRQPSRVKPELSPEQCQTIRAAIPKVEDVPLREMLFYSFEIMRFQGCRLMETRINPMKDVDFFTDANGAKRAVLTLRVKGGRELVTALHEKLLPMFERLKADGRPYTWETPRGMGYTWASGHWWTFLKQIGLKSAGITPHCARVTAVSELARNNVPESKSQKLVGHSTKRNHRIYQRFHLSELFDSMNVVGGSLTAPEAT